MPATRPDQTLLSRRTAETLAKGLGLFSIGLGLVELLAPRRLTRTLGMPGFEGVVQAYGVREITNGVAILASHDPTPWLWTRVGGDALDLATLATGLDSDNARKSHVMLAFAAVAGVTAADIACARALEEQRETHRGPFRDFSDRSGFPRPPNAMRGAARDFAIPKDFRTPELLRPFPQSRGAAPLTGSPAS
ncbi:DUF4267 domain-containing protein [Methylobacterium nodulans]|uniref:Cyclase dehydrase n=1 Tax=Methylobacterium nodulans (strain LMG 21967 / CNCM I-2342 / ORS 2060) TaxID=460265 RepID=B8IJZ1_METNO|nr:DUF4267 domain-containing protein [Methylobacterium nodulans]ACL60004.1 conserved hypothetical protein [Methylobacterium nodulans ORS 2060]